MIFFRPKLNIYPVFLLFISEADGPSASLVYLVSSASSESLSIFLYLKSIRGSFSSGCREPAETNGGDDAFGDSPHTPDQWAQVWAGSLGIRSSPSCAWAAGKGRGADQWNGVKHGCCRIFKTRSHYGRNQLIKPSRTNRITGKLFTSSMAL